jgi:nucleoside 2-deoxyribosyltransferase
VIYLIGSLRNPDIPKIANQLREAGHEVFDDWHAAGPNADDEWKRYEQERGRSYVEALKGHAAVNVFWFDRKNLHRADRVVLVLPAGKSGHLELGWALGQGKPGYVLLDNPDRWDVMYQFANGVFVSVDDLIEDLRRTR